MRVAAVLIVVGALAGPPAVARSASPIAWHTVWVRSQSPAPNAPQLTNQTVRVITPIGAGGRKVRVRFENAFGKSPNADGTAALTVDAATVARRATGAALAAGSLRRLTFSGQTTVTIAPGSWGESDPVDLDVGEHDDLAVSAHTPFASPPAHNVDTVTNYVSGAGDATADTSGAAFTSTTTSTPLVAGVEVTGAPVAGTVAAIGGSVVDGYGSTRDGHDDWPDDLGRRMDAVAPSLRKAVVNAGIAGTTASRACSSAAGPGAQDRLQRDVLSFAGITDLIVYAGTNDLAGATGVPRCNAAQVIAAMTDIVHQAHARGVRVLISTVTPRASYDAGQNADRATINAWIRKDSNCSGVCDQALDFDAALRDPAQPDRMDPALDSGDGIHPNPEGYARIAQSIDLASLGVIACDASRTLRLALPAHARAVRVLVNGRPAPFKRQGRKIVVRLTARSPSRFRVQVKARGYHRTRIFHLCAGRHSPDP